MSTPEDFLTAAARFYACVKAGRWGDAQQYVADDFTVIEAADLPFGGNQRGRPAVQESFEVLQRSFDLVGVETIATTAGGDFVVSLIDLTVRDADGGEFPLHLAETMQFVGGKIARVQPFYFDHDQVHRAIDAKTRRS